MKNYQRLASRLQAAKNCEKVGSSEWLAKHEAVIANIMSNAPSGSGIDCGTKLLKDECRITRLNVARLVFQADFHHMDTDGYYDGWSEHKVTVTPSFDGIDISISGRNRNNIKEYLHDTFYHWLNESAE
jgi:hypothetical protein